MASKIKLTTNIKTREIINDKIEFLNLRFNTFVKANKKPKRKNPEMNQII